MSNALEEVFVSGAPLPDKNTVLSGASRSILINSKAEHDGRSKNLSLEA